MHGKELKNELLRTNRPAGSVAKLTTYRTELNIAKLLKSESKFLVIASNRNRTLTIVGTPTHPNTAIGDSFLYSNKIQVYFLKYTVREKKRNQFSFVCIFLVLDRKLWIFFTYIRRKESRSISYNSVYLILACIENFVATVTLNILRHYQSSNKTDDCRLAFIVSISLLRKILNACQN